jgi:hypothetical protein
MPVNWYAALVVIVLVGLLSVALSKYHYNQTAAAVEPTTNTTWHAGLAFDICGTMEPALPASTASATATTGLTSSGSGVLQIHPKDSSESGNNATLGKFAQGYTGLTITNNTLLYPSKTVPEYKDGQKCATGTPDAGKVGTVQARWWVLTTVSSNHEEPVGGLTTKSPADLKFQNRQLITVGFGPADQPLPKPPGSTVIALQQTLAGAGPVATTTTAPATTSTTVPSTTSSVPASSTTTSTTKPPAASTTTAPPTTTTTKPTGTTSTTK